MRSVPPGDPFLEVRGLGADGRVVAVAGAHHRLGRQRQQPVRIESMIVGKSL